MFCDIPKIDKTKMLLLGSSYYCESCGDIIVLDDKLGVCCKNISCDKASFSNDDIVGLGSFKNCLISIHGYEFTCSDVRHYSDTVKIRVNIKCGDHIPEIIVNTISLTPTGCSIKAIKKFDDISLCIGDEINLDWVINKRT